MDKYRVTLTAEERIPLEQLVSTGKAAARKLTHAHILLLADTHGENRSDDDIVDALGASPRTVARVRQHFVTRSLEAALDRKAQPPRPDKIKIKGNLEQKLVQLASSEPPAGVASGPCHCWLTNWSSWGWSEPSAWRPCGRRSKKRHPALGRGPLDLSVRARVSRLGCSRAGSPRVQRALGGCAGSVKPSGYLIRKLVQRLGKRWL
jgi:hypothetical protein